MTFDRSRFRAELLLQLPDRAYRYDVPPGDVVGVASVSDSTEIDDVVLEHDYDRDALAAWILEQTDAAAETPDDQLGRIVEVAGAGSTIKAFAEFADYLLKLGTVLRRGHTLASQTDLARTIEAEAAKLRGIAAELVGNYPELIAVEVPDRGLVLPGQTG